MTCQKVIVNGLGVEKDVNSVGNILNDYNKKNNDKHFTKIVANIEDINNKKNIINKYRTKLNEISNNEVSTNSEEVLVVIDSWLNEEEKKTAISNILLGYLNQRKNADALIYVNKNPIDAC